MKKELFDNYIPKLKDLLEKEDFAWIDYSLEFIYASVPEKDRMPLEDLLQEVTLFAEFKEKEYKDTALEIIEWFEKEFKK